MQLNDGTNLEGYGTINVVLGKNGSGKSTLLRKIDESLSTTTAYVRYVTPERGGELTYSGDIETNRANDPNWESRTRRRNQWTQFRQSSVVEFRNFENLILRSIENDPAVRKSKFKFDDVIDMLNSFLDRVELKRSDSSGFDLFLKEGEKIDNASNLSSGESEYISLAIEILYFSNLCKHEKYRGQENWLLLDEPDVHLHPDLQDKLMKLVVSCLAEDTGRVAIATHSTTIVSSLCTSHLDIRIGLMQFGTEHLKFQSADDTWRLVLPIFGAHPLSSVFNENPPLIVEGEDDERIWQTAVRHSEGGVMVYPCVAGNVGAMSKLECTANELMKSIYDDAKAFSLRDRDDNSEEIGDVGLVVRCRLACWTAENLIVSDDVLEELETNWDKRRGQMQIWMEKHNDHTGIR